VGDHGGGHEHVDELRGLVGEHLPPDVVLQVELVVGPARR
jgi:hypothetical protein